LNLRSGYILNPLDINRSPSLGLGVDPTAPRLLSESLERKGVCSEPCDSMGGAPFATYQTPLTLSMRQRDITFLF